ncbi:MAG: copper resistance protein B [Alteromonadaceae bacterium]|nr:copper resistance protein B [Alteromonadaceae bacterium]
MKILNYNINHVKLLKPLLATALVGSGLVFTSAFATETTDVNIAKTQTSVSKEKPSMQGGSAPDNARDPNANSGGFEYRGMAGWEETDEITFSKIIADQFEYRNNNGNGTLRWDVQGWRGTDYSKLWFKFEGENETSSSSGDLELQTLYSYSVAAFWDFQLGARYDRFYTSDKSNDRVLAVVGFQGLAPYWFDMEPAIFVSDSGDVSARITSTYDLLITQKLILQPRFEINASASEVTKLGIGKGLNDIQLGMRLRYELRREVAPYIGFSYTKLYGDSKKFATINNEKVDQFLFVAGVRFWF